MWLINNGSINRLSGRVHSFGVGEKKLCCKFCSIQECQITSAEERSLYI